MLSYISYNRVGEPIVWDFVRNEWEYLVERFTLNDRYLGSLIPTITKKFATEMRLQEMKDFFAKYPDAGAGEANRQGWLHSSGFEFAVFISLFVIAEQGYTKIL